MASGLISTQQLQQLMADGPLTLLDVRGMGSYLKGHLPGAVATRWQDFTDPDTPIKGMLHPDSRVLAERFSALGVSNDVPVVLYSEPFENWGAEGRFFWMLHYLGHNDVRILDGGYPLWKKRGGEIARIPTKARAGGFSPIIRLESLIDKEGVIACLNDSPDTVVVDARGHDEYIKEGHLPGAVNLSWLTLYDEEGKLKPEGELRAMLDAAGITPDKEIVPYCTGGVRSAWFFFVLYTLGYPRLRNYDGSWWEWSADPDLPLDH